MVTTFWACYLAIILRKASPQDWKDLSQRIGLNLAGCLAGRDSSRQAREKAHTERARRELEAAPSETGTADRVKGFLRGLLPGGSGRR